jgi:hypothetical protein
MTTALHCMYKDLKTFHPGRIRTRDRGRDDHCTLYKDLKALQPGGIRTRDRGRDDHHATTLRRENVDC